MPKQGPKREAKLMELFADRTTPDIFTPGSSVPFVSNLQENNKDGLCDCTFFDIVKT